MKIVIIRNSIKIKTKYLINYASSKIMKISWLKNIELKKKYLTN